jgi:hypothetical protein
MSHANVVVKQEENIAPGVPRTMNIALQGTIRVTNEVASYVSFKSATMLLHTLFFTDESIQPWRMTVYAVHVHLQCSTCTSVRRHRESHGNNTEYGTRSGKYSTVHKRMAHLTRVPSLWQLGNEVAII